LPRISAAPLTRFDATRISGSFPEQSEPTLGQRTLTAGSRGRGGRRHGHNVRGHCEAADIAVDDLPQNANISVMNRPSLQ
jgi:hypothetical protein